MIFKLFADNNNPNSLATRLRKKRFSLFISLLSQLERPITILDVGGTEQFWQMQGFSDKEDVKVTLLNLDEYPVSTSNFMSIKGDACDLKFPDNSFNVVFSNSVIEHVGNLERQRQMAREIKRVGMCYFVQTPNKYFFIEPHFVFPFFQFLPIALRVWLLTNFKLGWFNKEPNDELARNIIKSIRLLSKEDMLALFPGCKLYQEKIFGMTKSYVAYSGWE